MHEEANTHSLRCKRVLAASGLPVIAMSLRAFFVILRVLRGKTLPWQTDNEPRGEQPPRGSKNMRNRRGTFHHLPEGRRAPPNDRKRIQPIAHSR
jgi:hypothetical protein